jgi:hypothetical protein
LLGAGSPQDDLISTSARAEAQSGAAGRVLSGGGGSDRYRIAHSAAGAPVYLDNSAPDLAPDTLEFHLPQSWKKLTLWREDDDLWLCDTPDAPTTSPQAHVVLLNYYADPKHRHIALELIGENSPSPIRFSASELERMANGDLSQGPSAVPSRSLQLEQLITHMASWHAGSADAFATAQTEDGAGASPALWLAAANA